MSQSPGPLLSVRLAFALTLALAVAIIAGVLSYFSAHDLPGAILVAGGACTGSMSLVHALLAR